MHNDPLNVIPDSWYDLPEVDEVEAEEKKEERTEQQIDEEREKNL